MSSLKWGKRSGKARTHSPQRMASLNLALSPGGQEQVNTQARLCNRNPASGLSRRARQTRQLLRCTQPEEANRGEPGRVGLRPGTWAVTGAVLQARAGVTQLEERLTHTLSHKHATMCTHLSPWISSHSAERGSISK